MCFRADWWTTCINFESSADARKAALTQALFPTQDTFDSHKQWIATTVQKLIKEHTLKVDGLSGSRLDIVGNVANLAPVYWVSEFIVCSLRRPLQWAGEADDLGTSSASRSRRPTRRTVCSLRRRSTTCFASSSGTSEEDLVTLFALTMLAMHWQRGLPECAAGEQLVHQQACILLHADPDAVHREGPERCCARLHRRTSCI